MYKLYQAGDFGNKPQTWNSIGDYLSSGFTGEIAIRYKLPASPFCRFGLNRDSVDRAVEDFIKAGAKVELMTFNEVINDESITIQGEVQRGLQGYDLRYSHAKKPMRNALSESQEHASGLRATMLLRHFMDSSSYEDLQLLFDSYPDSVVEFTACSRDLGNIPNRNTVFWEVRNY